MICKRRAKGIQSGSAMRLIIFFLVTLSLASCASSSYNIGFGYNYSTQKVFQYEIKHQKNTKTKGRVSIEYKSFDILLAENIVRLRNELVPESEVKVRAYEGVPRGGAFTINIERQTIKAANTKHFTYVVINNGIEILRAEGLDKIANVPTTPKGMWWNVSAITLKQALSGDIKVIVIDKINVGRDEFVIIEPSA